MKNAVFGYTRAANARMVCVGQSNITFWHRAASSVGRLEWSKTSYGRYGSVIVWGYMVSMEVWSTWLATTNPSSHAIELPWARYNVDGRPHSRVPEFVERNVARLFAWLIRMPAVQRAIVDQFEDNSTPMCGALSRAISSAQDRNVVDVDDVEGLERYVNDAIAHAMEEKDADDVVRSVIDEVADQLADRLRGR